jgi:hypothetical protein
VIPIPGRRRLIPHAGASVLFSLLILATGSRAANDPCSLANGLPWREYRSQHFVIDVAGADREPALLVAAFEDLYAAVLAALIAEPVEIPAQVHVIVLPRESDLVDYTGSRDVAGLFWISDRGEPTILISGDQVEHVPQILAHELTHYVSSYLFPASASGSPRGSPSSWRVLPRLIARGGVGRAAIPREGGPRARSSSRAWRRYLPTRPSDPIPTLTCRVGSCIDSSGTSVPGS